MYLKRLTPLIAALALTVTAGGCATIGTLQTANTLGKASSRWPSPAPGAPSLHHRPRP